MSAEGQREQWGSGLGFILATMGSAAGLGNIWRFAYVAGENGGGAFLLVYVLAVIVIGLPLAIAEIAIGRTGRSDAVDCFRRLAPGSAWPLVGWIGVAGCVLILSYYSVIAGWVAAYLAGALTGDLWEQAGAGFGGYFQGFIGGALAPVLWQAAITVASVLIVASGVRGGIERANRILMPALILVVLALAVRGLLLPGGGAGAAFLLAPDWASLSDPGIYLAALGQAFFSIGLGMAVYLVYGSYLADRHRIPTSAGAVIAGDTCVAILAGLAIFPAVFALGMDPAAGPELAFITLPQVFLEMPGGRIVGALFFALLVAAALTSMVSLVEVPVTHLMRSAGLSRPAAAALVGVLVILLGLPVAWSYGLLGDVRLLGRPILDAVDHVVSDYLLPAAGLGIALFAGWAWGGIRARAAAGLERGPAGWLWLWTLRVTVPAGITVIALRAAGAF